MTPSRLRCVVLRGLEPGRSDEGATLVEYALLVAFIALVCVVAIGYVGGWANTTLTSVADRL